MPNQTYYGLNIWVAGDTASTAIENSSNVTILDAAAGHVWQVASGTANEQLVLSVNAISPTATTAIAKFASPSSALYLNLAGLLQLFVTPTGAAAAGTINWPAAVFSVSPTGATSGILAVTGSGSAVVIGGNPAQTGAVRLANATSIQQRNAANANDLQIAGYTNANVLQIGDTSAAALELEALTRPSVSATVGLGTVTQTFKFLGLVAAVTTTNGYTYLPNGLIYQWGTSGNITVPGGGGSSGTVSVTFPLAFPTACLNVTVMPTVSTIAIFNSQNITAVSFTANGTNTGAGQQVTSVMWQAIGV